jgi:hypothetical protein
LEPMLHAMGMVHGRCVEHLAHSMHRLLGGELAKGHMWQCATCPSLEEFVQPYSFFYKSNPAKATQLCPPLAVDMQKVEGREHDRVWKALLQEGLIAVNAPVTAFPTEEQLKELCSKLQISGTEDMTAVDLYCVLVRVLNEQAGVVEEEYELPRPAPMEVNLECLPLEEQSLFQPQPGGLDEGSDGESTDLESGSGDDVHMEHGSDDDVDMEHSPFLASTGAPASPPSSPPSSPLQMHSVGEEGGVPVPPPRSGRDLFPQEEALFTTPLEELLPTLDAILKGSQNCPTRPFVNSAAGSVHKKMPITWALWQYCLQGCLRLTEPSTNCGESWNGMILDGRRTMPIPCFIDFVTMRAIAHIRSLASSLPHQASSDSKGNALKMEAGKYYWGYAAGRGPNVYWVSRDSTGQGQPFYVDVDKCTCTCGFWQFYGRACVHVWNLIIRNVASAKLSEESATAPFMRPQAVGRALMSIVEGFNNQMWRGPRDGGPVDPTLVLPGRPSKRGRTQVKRHRAFVEWLLNRRGGKYPSQNKRKKGGDGKRSNRKRRRPNTPNLKKTVLPASL